MRFSNFEYDGISLQDKGLGIVSFSGMQDDDITTDSQRSFESISLYNGKYQPFLTSVYEDRLEIEFSIGKNYCVDDDNETFSIAEIEDIQYWLNRPTPHIFRILDDEEYADVFWEGSFNLTWVKAGEDTIGLNATFISNRPYGIGTESSYVQELGGSNSLIVNDMSYDEGSIVPNVVITILEAGDLELTNTFNGKTTVTKINSCTNNEEIIFTNLQQVLSSNTNHDVYSNFNWVFPRIYNLYDNVKNVFTSNLRCNCVISYNPIRKVTFS